MNTPFVQLHFSLCPPGTKLPAEVLFAVRHCFPKAFRTATGCLTASQGCTGGSACPCRTLFDQNLSSDPAALRRYQKPPLPFAFNIPLLPGRSAGGGEVELSLVIVGEAINHIELFVRAVRSMFDNPGMFSGWRAGNIEASSGDGSRADILAGGTAPGFSSLPLLSFDEILSQDYPSCSRITVEFLTPLRLLHKGAPLREIRFSALAGALFRRVSSLAYYYGKEELTHDFKWLSERSREIVSTHRDLLWVNRGGGLQGVEGVAEFSGELAEFIPFLSLGSLLNAGKGAAYGMGSYRFAMK